MLKFYYAYAIYFIYNRIVSAALFFLIIRTENIILLVIYGYIHSYCQYLFYSAVSMRFFCRLGLVLPQKCSIQPVFTYSIVLTILAIHSFYMAFYAMNVGSLLMLTHSYFKTYAGSVSVFKDNTVTNLKQVTIQKLNNIFDLIVQEIIDAKFIIILYNAVIGFAVVSASAIVYIYWKQVFQSFRRHHKNPRKY